ncbi:MAG: TonB-dependent receptor plug domain-containing protein, partial [Bacteroidales bacterium]|nr:TonB-dependent receptor plug domain-containing protein [Bacteroidales bacterium]
LKTNEISLIPSIGARPDVSKGLQLLPGITSQKEGSSLLLVRGGDPGQNAYLFDNVPVIHVNHLGGFMSVFNPEIINSINVYKGGFPARYGNRLSSIVDIAQKEGDKSGLKGSVGIGLTDVSLLVEGPLKFKNTSFVLAGRKTLIDPLLALVSIMADDNDFIISYGFHDINGKLSWKPGVNNSFSFNIYHGDDYVNYWSDPKKKEELGEHRFNYSWGNLLLSANYKSVLASGALLNSSIAYTRYRYRESRKFSYADSSFSPDFQSKYLSSVRDFSFRTNLKHALLRNWSFEAGLQASFMIYLPGLYKESGSDGSKQSVKSTELAAFMGNNINLFKYISIKAGIRIADYRILNEQYDKFMLEPRVNLLFTFIPHHDLSLSYMMINQHSHLLFTSGNFFANEVWVPANGDFHPSNSDQLTFSWCAGFKENSFSAEVSMYYKRMNDLITYKEGYSNMVGTDDWQSRIEHSGSGVSKGCELFIKKNTGKWTGFASYTISRTTRKYPGINDGKEYLFDFDRLHTFSVLSQYKISDRLNLSLSWVYQSGLPWTPAVGRQYIPTNYTNEEGETIYSDALIYGEKNSSRMKDYHRLDLGLNYETTTKKGRKAVLSFSVYNCYNRHNPYFYYYSNTNWGEWNSTDPEKPLALYQRSFFPIMPSLSYKVYFDKNADMVSKTRFGERFKKWLYHQQ